jgi:hypothetical protein
MKSSERSTFAAERLAKIDYATPELVNRCEGLRNPGGRPHKDAELRHNADLLTIQQFAGLAVIQVSVVEPKDAPDLT